MARRMSCAMTVDAVVHRIKTVTRLILVEKAMGLPKGSKKQSLPMLKWLIPGSNRSETSLASITALQRKVFRRWVRTSAVALSGGTSMTRSPHD